MENEERHVILTGTEGLSDPTEGKCVISAIFHKKPGLCFI